MSKKNVFIVGPEITYATRIKIEYDYVDGLVQGRRNASALAMELRLSCTNPSMCELHYNLAKTRSWYVCGLFQLRKLTQV